ncbi:hypothetical protein LINPERHAP1_LOCUS19271 [Linum perenne]
MLPLYLQELMTSARLELREIVEFEEVVFWSHEVKISDLLGVDLLLLFIIFQLTVLLWLGKLL